jgi:inorganic triphosphatase YgiF
MPKEVELRLELAPKSLRALRKMPLLRTLGTPPKRSAEVSVYFDTEKHKLHKKGLMLRVRRVGDRYVQTIKASGNGEVFERDEWETEVNEEQPDLSYAAGTALDPLLHKRLHRKLKPLFETRVQRTVYVLADDTRAIALSVDKGTIDTGTRSMPLCEIELELRRGSTAELFGVARELSRALKVQIGVKSKSERGYELVDGEEGAPVKSTPVELLADLSTREAFKTVGRACLKQIVGNAPALNTGNPEGVHQMRVGLRRLRAAMSLFAGLLRDPQTKAVKTELKWLAGQLGPARELEVLIDRVIAPIRGRHAHRNGVVSLSQELDERREAALTRAQTAVQSARFRALTLEVAAWLEAGQWTSPRDDLVRDRGDLPVAVTAAEQFTQRWRKVRKKGKTLAQLDARSRHKLRIQTKKLRYAAEFFSSLFTGKRRERFQSELERLQDGLGDLNDIAVHENRIAMMSICRRRSSPNRAFAAGLLTGREDSRVAAAMATATAAYANLTKIKPFWR